MRELPSSVRSPTAGRQLLEHQSDRAVDTMGELGEGEQENDPHAKDHVHQEDNTTPNRSSRQIEAYRTPE